MKESEKSGIEGYIVSLFDFKCSQFEKSAFFASQVEAVTIVNDPRLYISLSGNKSSLLQGIIASSYALVP